MPGIPQNVVPANTEDLVEGTVSGVTTQAQAIAADVMTSVVNSAAGVAQAAAQTVVAQAQAKAAEEVAKLTNQLKLPQDALIALAILGKIFSYEELAELSIEDIKKRLKASKTAFKLSRPKLPEIPKINIPSPGRLIDSAIPDIFPNDSGLDAYTEQLLDKIKEFRRREQTRFEQLAAERAKNMFELRKQLVEEESNRLISNLINKATSVASAQVLDGANTLKNNGLSSLI